MSTFIAKQIFHIKQFTNGAITFNYEEGWRKATIKNKDDSSGDVTITTAATDVLSGTASSSGGMTLEAGESIDIGTDDSPAIDGLTVTVPDGTTVKIVAMKWGNTKN